VIARFSQQATAVHHGFANHASIRHGNEVFVRPTILGLWCLGGFTHLQDVGEEAV
jgi:hypothetical protein